MGDHGGPKAVVNVDHADTRRTGGEHAEHGGQTAEMAAVADRGGDRDDGCTHESSQHCRERTFHASNGDDDASFPNLRQRAQQAMKARHPHIDMTHHLRAEGERSLGSFFGDGQVAGARTDHGDMAHGLDGMLRRDEAKHASDRQPLHIGQLRLDRGGLAAVDARGDGDLSGSVDASEKGGHLVRRLGRSEHHLWLTDAPRAVEIEPRKAKVGGRRRVEQHGGRGRGGTPRLHVAQQDFEG